jgi:YD repeat-containing protein
MARKAPTAADPAAHPHAAPGRRSGAASRILAVAVLLFALSLGCTAATGLAGPGMFAGVAVTGSQADGTTPGAGIDVAQSDGLGAVRIPAVWTRGQIRPGFDQLLSLTNAANAAVAAGLHPVVAIYNSDASSTPAASRGSTQFAQYAAAVARAMPAVTDFVVGNEPNSDAYWLPQFGTDGSDVAAVGYEALLAGAYDAIKAVRSDARVIGGALASRGDNLGAQQHSPSSFIADLGAAYRASGRSKPLMDAIDVHIYDDGSMLPTGFTSSDSTSLGDYPRLVAALGHAFDGTAQVGSTLPILYGEVEVASGGVAPGAAASRYSEALQMAACQPNVIGLMLVQESTTPSFSVVQPGAAAVPDESVAAIRRAAKALREGRFDSCTDDTQTPLSTKTEPAAPAKPAAPSKPAATPSVSEPNYGFVRDTGTWGSFSIPFARFREAGLTGVLIRGDDPGVSDALVAARGAGMSAGVWLAPSGGESPEDFAHRLADLSKLGPSIVVPDVEFIGKGYQGSSGWDWSDKMMAAYRALAPDQATGVTLLPNQDDFNYGAYLSRGVKLFMPQAYGETYATQFNANEVTQRVVSNGVPADLVEPVVAPGQAHGAGAYGAYAMDDFSADQLASLGGNVTTETPAPLPTSPILPNPFPTPEPADRSNDNLVSAKVLDGESGSVTSDNSDATLEDGEPLMPADDAYGGGSLDDATKTLWYRWTPPASAVGGAFEVDTFAPADSADHPDTALAIYAASSADAPFSDLTLVTSNDDWHTGSVPAPDFATATHQPTASAASFTVDPGTTYFVQVSTVHGAEPGRLHLNWNRLEYTLEVLSSVSRVTSKPQGIDYGFTVDAQGATTVYNDRKSRFPAFQDVTLTVTPPSSQLVPQVFLGWKQWHAGADGQFDWYPVNGCDDAAATTCAITLSEPDTYVVPVFEPKPVSGAQTFGNGDGVLARNPTATAGDGVNTATGSYHTSATDLSLSGDGVPFALTRSYNSADHASGPFGTGWTSSLGWRIVDLDGYALVRDGSGQQLVYTEQPDGSFRGPGGGLATLSSTDGGYELLTADRTHYRFDGDGRLLSIKDDAKQGLTLQYADGHLSGVTDSAGHTVSVSSGSDGLVDAVTLPDGTSARYGYDQGRLTSVTTAAGVTRYAYDADGNLATVVAPDGSTLVRNRYGSQGRVLRQTDARGRTTSFAWDAPSSTATITDPKGTIHRDVYTDNTLTERVDSYGGMTTFTYNASLDLTSVIDSLGNTTTMTYDDRHNLLTRSGSAPLPYEVSWTYDDRNHVTSYTDAQGNTTRYEYNAAGTLVRVAEPTTGGNRSQPGTWRVVG